MRIVRDIQCVLHTHEQEEDFFSAVINEYQLAALYINDFRQWSAFSFCFCVCVCLHWYSTQEIRLTVSWSFDSINNIEFVCLTQDSI